MSFFSLSRCRKDNKTSHLLCGIWILAVYLQIILTFTKMGFFYRPKPKGFNYIPRYYDPEKEAWEQKKAEAGLNTNLSHEEELRLQMRKKWGVNKDKEDPTERRSKMIRTLIIVGIVVVAFYYIFCTPMFTNIISGLMGK